MLSVGVALIQFWPSWTLVPAVLGVFVLGQAVADYVWRLGSSASEFKLSPVLILLAVAAFGYLFGFVGLLIAVPLAATIGVIARFILSQELLNVINTSHPAPEGVVRRVGSKNSAGGFDRRLICSPS